MCDFSAIFIDATNWVLIGLTMGDEGVCRFDRRRVCALSCTKKPPAGSINPSLLIIITDHEARRAALVPSLVHGGF